MEQKYNRADLKTMSDDQLITEGSYHFNAFGTYRRTALGVMFTLLCFILGWVIAFLLQGGSQLMTIWGISILVLVIPCTAAWILLNQKFSRRHLFTREILSELEGRLVEARRRKSN